MDFFKSVPGRLRGWKEHIQETLVRNISDVITPRGSVRNISSETSPSGSVRSISGETSQSGSVRNISCATGRSRSVRSISGETSQSGSDREEEFAEPGIPMCMEVSSNSVTLKWNKPLCNHNKIHYYTVKYRIQDEMKFVSVDTKSNLNFFRIDGLKCDAAYEFRVRAVFHNGDEGRFSKPCQNIMTKKSILRDLTTGAQKLGDGKPTIYKLNLTESRNSVNSKAKARRYVFGKRPRGSFQEKTVMVVGGTGVGKSTLINAIVNHIMDVNWEDDVRLSVIEQTDDEMENSKDQTMSQTEWTTCYTIFPREGSKLDYTINIIDTPGFGDTRGIERDRELVEHIRTLFNSSGERGIEILDAVWFVAQGSDTRLTASQRYVFDSILSIFGKDIEKNIFVLVTFADNKNPPVLNILKTANMPCKKSFVFNNSALFENPEDHEVNGCGQQYWKMGKENFNQLFSELIKTEPRSIQLSAEVLNTRRQLLAMLQGAQMQIQDGLIKMDRIRQEESIFRNLKENVAET